MVRVLAIADEEVPVARGSRLADVRPDVVLAAGDLPWGYVEAVVALFDVPAAFVPGNHDPRTTGGARPGGVVDVDGRVVDVGGIRVAGLGGCVRYNDGHHQYTQAQYDRRARQLLRASRRGGGVDVLLTHAPPLGLGDEPDAAHRGISALHGVLEALQPTWHLHGHIHPYGMPKPDRHVGPTTIRNVVPWQVVELEPRGTRVVAGAGRRR